MPVVPLERLPLPNLKVYSFVSVVALSACIYYAAQIIKEPNWNYPTEFDKKDSGNAAGARNTTDADGRTVGQFVSDVFTVMIREPVCVWVSFPNLYLIH